MASRVRVLLVEDDITLQRFVSMALEDDEVRMQACISVDEALLALATQSFDLVISDLMLPGRHGLDLLQTLKQRPALRGNARLAVFSAGINPAVREQLEALGVTRFLSKPCSLGDLQSCLDGLRDAAPPAAMPSIHQAAIEQYFGGKAALYQAFLARCRMQFPLDIANGRLACDRGEHVKLRHLAHSLKSVLLTLGHAEAAEVARQLELDAEQAATGSEDALAAARAAWPVLEEALAKLL